MGEQSLLQISPRTCNAVRGDMDSEGNSIRSGITQPSTFWRDGEQ